MIKIYKTFFNNEVKLIKLKKFTDKRGHFIENFNIRDLKNLGISSKFVQDNESLSVNKGTIRGLHFQTKPLQQAKLISVKKGSICDVFVDINKTSKTFGMYKKIILRSTDNFLLYIPYNFAHGFCTLENNTIVSYKISNYYSPNHERTLDYNDNHLKINWPRFKNTKYISNKDLNGIKFLELKDFL